MHFLAGTLLNSGRNSKGHLVLESSTKNCVCTLGHVRSALLANTEKAALTRRVDHASPWTGLKVSNNGPAC